MQENSFAGDIRTYNHWSQRLTHNRLSQLGDNEGLNLNLILHNRILPFMLPTFMVPEIQHFIKLTTFSSHAQ